MPDTNAGALPAYYQNSRPELVQLVEPRDLRILEVGCAAGAMGAAFLQKGAREVVGLDVFAPALELARGRLSAVHQADLNQLPALPYPDGYFDLITFADVLEHLTDPAAVLRHLRRWLRDGGQILCSIPNVRHESVVLPLLVDGRWDYADWGILDRTHLRFFTRQGVRALLAEAGFQVCGKMAGVQSARPPYVAKAAELVAALGGNVSEFLEECDVVQFVFLARAQTAGPAARAPSPSAPPAQPTRRDPWAGSRPVHVLLVPALDDPRDCWATALPVLARSLHGNRAVTLAVALPAASLGAPPAPVKAVAGKVDLDLLLTATPRDVPGWEQLLRGTKLLVLTSEQPQLSALARRLGVEVRDARREPQLRGELPPPAAVAPPIEPRAER